MESIVFVPTRHLILILSYLDITTSVFFQGDFQEPVIQVEAPQLVKFCTAIQLEPGTTAGEIVAKCKRGSGRATQRESGGSLQNGR